MTQPWTRAGAPEGPHVPVRLAYGFDVRDVPDGDLFLALERPETFRVRLNGHAVDTDACGWWCDRSLQTVRLDPAVLRRGGNELVLEIDYHAQHSGLEIVYLLGRFGVAGTGARSVLTAAPVSLAVGDWCGQGLPYYAGSVVYERALRHAPRKGQRVFLAVPEFRGVAVRFWVNGAAVGLAGWPPYEADLTDHLRAGANDIGIEIVGHRRNSHGPFHIARRWPEWTGPGEYRAERGQPGWFEDHQIVPCGLMANPKLVVRELRRRS